MKKRLLEIADFMGLSVRSFEVACGLQRGNISNMSEDSAIGSDKLTKIIDSFPFFNVEWLLTGNGEMIKKNVDKESLKPGVECRYIEMVPVSEKLPSSVPLVMQNAIAGFGNADFVISEADVKEYYIIPKFKYCKVDFMIEISGSSMYPKYNSGDIVACTIIRDSTFIQWNKCHIIATQEQGILCKRLRQASKENYLLAVSDNNDYPPFEISTDEITGVALVVGVIRLE